MPIHFSIRLLSLPYILYSPIARLRYNRRFMKPILFLLAAYACFASLSAKEPYVNWDQAVLAAREVNPDYEAYIAQYRDIAIREMERSGVPASIKLAQGLLESGAGTSELARRAKNHFGIKCGSNWLGETMYREDDDFDANGELIKSCFRSYRNADASFVAHSEFLRDPGKAFRYGFLFRLDPRDYRAWAEGLRRAGYATNPRYPELLISLIDRYKLYQYDNFIPIDIENPGVEGPIVIGPGPGRPTRPTRPPGGNIDEDIFNDINEGILSGILKTNDVTYFVPGQTTTLDDVARRVDVSIRRLIDYNESINAPNQPIAAGERIFIQPKRNSYRGQEKYHLVLAGQTMFQLAQKYGVKLEKLRRRNRMEDGGEPAAGTRIKLRGGKQDRPKLASETSTQPSVPTRPDGNLDVDNTDPIRPTRPPVRPTNPTTNPRPGVDNPGTVTPGTVTPGTTDPYTPPTNPGIDNNTDFGGGTRPTTPVTPPTTDPYTPPTSPYVPPTTDPYTPPTSPYVPPVTNPPTQPTTPPAATGRTYNVVAGDTLYSISRRYNLSVEQLKRLNGLTDNTISIGQVLTVQ